jgi:hypothetical protein
MIDFMHGWTWFEAGLATTAFLIVILVTFVFAAGKPARR